MNFTTFARDSLIREDISSLLSPTFDFDFVSIDFNKSRDTGYTLNLDDLKHDRIREDVEKAPEPRLNDVPSKFETKTQQLASGEQISYRENTKGGVPTVVAIHDHMFSSLAFEPLMAELDRKVHILAPCLRGQGFSSYNNAPGRLEGYTEDIFYLLYEQHLMNKPLYLLGSGLGAVVAMNLAQMLPGNVRGMVLLNPWKPTADLTKEAMRKSQASYKHRFKIYDLA